MDDDDLANLDTEFKRYLQIIQPYLNQLVDKDLIDICDNWIQRLSQCKDDEKSLRNKYVFALCYQLARGVLEEPFLKRPNVLQPLTDDINTDDSSTEVEYAVINPEIEDTKVILKPTKALVSDTEYLSQDNNFDEYESTNTNSFDNDVKLKRNKRCEKYAKKQALPCNAFPRTSKSNFDCEESDDHFDYRTNNLIMKLREIKTQNMMLHQEICSLKEESQMRSGTDDYIDKSFARIDNATSACFELNVSDSKIKSLKCKLQEVQDSRNNLIQTIINLQEKLDNFHDIKKHEIEDLKAKHRLEIITIKSSVKEEVTLTYENKLEEQKQRYEAKILEIDLSNSEKQSVNASKDNIIAVKDKVIAGKDTEIAQLKSTIEEQKENLQSIIKNFAETPKESLSSETLRIKAEQLEKRLSKVEKSKAKCARIYEAKLAQLQRDKHLIECSLQLQLVRQRAQVINEIADENQSELVTALDKLEAKYKDIVANVQSTAIQRRVQDQIALDSVIEKAIKSENMYTNCTRDPNRNQFSGRTMQNQGKVENRSYESELSVLRGNKVGNVVVGNKSFGEDSVMVGYCLDGERMGQLFERVCIPQRDTGDGSLKK